MKKYFLILFCIMLLSIVNVKAISCYDGIIEVNDSNFSCSDIQNDSVSFYHNGQDYSKYFSLNKNKNRINIIDKSISFDSSLALGIIEIVDGNNKALIRIKNPAYIESTTTMTTTTTTTKAKITYNVSFDSNDGSDILTKSCNITKEGETCSITLPNLDKDNFNGWGTQKNCKEGAVGTIKVSKNITYFACYNTDSSTTTKKSETELYLKSLKLYNESDNSEIELGTFSIRKFEYSIKVLNNVENIKVEGSSDENISIDIIGNKNLIVGDNEIIITLKDNQKNESIYKLNVKRLEEGETITNINYLSNLIVGGYNIDFDKNQFVYSLNIDKDIDRLELTPVAENEENIVEVIGNNDLENGSSIKINVTHDELNTVYTINIVKESELNILIIVSVLLIVLLIVILIVLIIVKNNQKKKAKINIPNRDDIEVLKI